MIAARVPSTMTGVGGKCVVRGVCSERVWGPRYQRYSWPAVTAARVPSTMTGVRGKCVVRCVCSERV